MTALADGLRELADWVDEHPEHELRVGSPMFSVPVLDKEELVEVARALGKAEKVYDDTFLNLRRAFGPVRLEFYIPREQVCERVVVETVHHPSRVVPAHVEEIVEWRCTDPILAGASA